MFPLCLGSRLNLLRLCVSRSLTDALSVQRILKAISEDIIIQYTYPRLDAEVSKHRNHLLKAPFCIHPKTGRVCVPVDPSTIEDFNPEEVPTVWQLMQELNAVSSATQEGSEHHSGKPHPSLPGCVLIASRLGEDGAAAVCGDAR